MKKIYDRIVILAGVVLIFISVRFLFLKYKYFYGADPYYHFAQAVNQGGILPLSPYLPVMSLYSITHILGISFRDTFRIAPPVFGALTVILLFLLVRRIFDGRVAILSAFILTLVPAFTAKTLATNYRGDIFGMSFYTGAFYLFFRAVQAEGVKNRLFFALLSGAFLTLSGAVWTVGYIFGVMLISAYLIMLLLTFRGQEDTLAVYAVALGFSIVSMLMLAEFNLISAHARYILPHGFTDFYRYVFPSIVAFGAMVSIVGRKIGDWAKVYAISVLVVMVSVAVFYVTNQEAVENTLSLYGGSWKYQDRPTSELAPVTWNVLWSRISMFSILAPLGFLYLLLNVRRVGEASKARLFVIVWFFAGMFLALNTGTRGLFTAALPFSILSAYLISESFKCPRGAKIAKLAAFSLILLVGLSSISGAQRIGPLMNDVWHESLVWLDQNTPEDSVVFSWWPFGYWINTIGGRTTVTDGGTSPGRDIENTARFYLEENESVAISYLEDWNVTHALITIDMLAREHNMYHILDTYGRPRYVVYGYTGETTLEGN
ncbi:MAG: STT3 domain-containing protein, partial [Candidatus Hydrothermarchaeaceae archaeon]